MPSSSIVRRDEAARVAFESLTGQSARTGRPIRCSPRDTETRYPFTVRLPVPMYARLREKAESERRSVAAQIELDLASIYG